jgi:secreted Zn-dependent insulinase-like peptidase
MNSWKFCDYLFNNSFENFYYYDKLLKIITKIKPKHILNYINDLFKDTGILTFIYGNIKLNEMPKLDKLDFNNKMINFKKLKIKRNLIKYHPNINEKSNCVQISYFVGKFDPLINLHLFFFKLISYNIFYKDLRTTKKLGYLVTMSSSLIGSEYYIYQKIQSELLTNEIINHIKTFNKTLIDNIKLEDFEKWRKTVKNHLIEKETNMNELFNKYYFEIYNRTYTFDKDKKMLKHINEISLESLINFIVKYIIKNKKINIIEIKSH